MTLQVPFDRFAETVKRVLPGVPAFVTVHQRYTLTTAADPVRNLVVAALCREGCTNAKEALKSQGIEAMDGVWREGVEASPFEEENAVPYVVAVSYKTDADMPGVWVDAFREQPTPMMALRNLFDEFRSTGEMGEVSFEEFVRIASPNVVVVSPDDLGSYVRAKEG